MYEGLYEALFYVKLEGGVVHCLLCPHNCTIAKGKVGLCRTRKNIEGTLYALTYGKVSTMSLDPIEKKPLYDFMPGEEIVSIGGFGCNLACEFCQNWDIVVKSDYLFDVDEELLMKYIYETNSIGLAYTYNEPTVWYEYMLHLSKKIKKAGLANVLVTNGYINAEPLEQLLPYIDAMNIDLKSMNNDFYKKICHGSLEPVLNSIKIAAKKVHLEVTCLVIDELNSRDDEIEGLAKFLSEIDEKIVLHLSAYYPARNFDQPATKVDTLINAKKIAKEYLDKVYIGNVYGLS